MKSLRIPLLVVVASLSAGGALAAGKNVGATFGTRDQLRECMSLDDALKLRSQALEASVKATNQQVADNDAEGARLGEMKKTLDRSDKAAIQKFNEAALAHNQHVKDAEQAGADEEAATRLFSDDRADMDQKCGSLTYRPADMDAIAKERSRKAAAVAVAASAP